MKIGVWGTLCALVPAWAAAQNSSIATCPMPGSTAPLPVSTMQQPTSPNEMLLRPYNMTVDSGCNNFSPSGGPSGLGGMMATIQDIVSDGVACLQANGVNVMRQRLLSVLTPGGTARNIRIGCIAREGDSIAINGVNMVGSDIAEATAKHTDPAYPGVVVNIGELNKYTPRSFKAAFFHELFHIAEIGHENAVDYPYLAAGCCYESLSGACDLLRMAEGKPADWWTSAAYLQRYVAFFGGDLTDHRMSVISGLLRSAAVAKPTAQAGVQAGLVQQLGRFGISASWKQYLLVRCLAASMNSGAPNPSALESQCVAAAPGANASYAEKVARLLSLRYIEGTRALNATETAEIATIRGQLNQSCSTLPGGAQPMNWIRDSDSFGAGGSIKKSLKEAFNHLCTP